MAIESDPKTFWRLDFYVPGSPLLSTLPSLLMRSSRFFYRFAVISS